jgi:hypothetical protein
MKGYSVFKMQFVPVEKEERISFAGGSMRAGFVSRNNSGIYFSAYAAVCEKSNSIRKAQSPCRIVIIVQLF